MKPEKTEKLNKKINIHLTRLNQLEELWSYSQSDISRPSPFWKSIYLSLEMSERNISLRGYLQMMYFLCVKFQENLLNRLIGMGGSIGVSYKLDLASEISIMGGSNFFSRGIRTIAKFKR
jgi:hypothetical protein